MLMLVMLMGCTTTTSTVKFDQSKYATLRGSGSAYVDRENSASGGVSSNEEAHTKASQALSQRDIDRALYFYVKALEFNPNDVNALLALARIHTAQGNLDPALLAYRLILDVKPDHIDATEGAALILLKVNKAKQAKIMLDKTNKLAPGRPMTLMGLGVYYDLTSDFDKANYYYQQAAKASPSSVKILNNYAYSRYLAGYWDEAENMYKKVLHIDPKHPQATLNYGLLQARKGDTINALQTLKKVLPESKAYNELGYIYMMQQDYGKARRMFELAISTSPTYFEQASKNLEQLKLQVSNLTKTGTENIDALSVR